MSLDPSFDPSVFFNEQPKPRFSKRIAGAVIAGFLCIAFALYSFCFAAPGNFPAGKQISVSEGSSLSQVATILHDDGVIRSAFLFKSFAYLFGGARNVSAGEYLFQDKASVWTIAERLTNGEHGVPVTKVTIPEGMSVAEISSLFAEKFPSISAKDFRKLAKGKEGYLFPDTYFFESNVTASSAIQAMSDNFATRTAEAEKESAAAGKKFSDVITMASILEKEANDTQSMAIISGILWKRINLGMPLQADATLTYVTGKGTSELTEEDLKSKSPYNSYVNAGLPPGPISNPGLVAIEAALNPSKTPYLYFLTDSKGKMHYAATLDEHAANKQKYLP